MGQGKLLFSHGFSLEFQSIGIVYDSIHDGIGQGRISEKLMPFGNRNLRGNKSALFKI